MARRACCAEPASARGGTDATSSPVNGCQITTVASSDADATYWAGAGGQPNRRVVSASARRREQGPGGVHLGLRGESHARHGRRVPAHGALVLAHRLTKLIASANARPPAVVAANRRARALLDRVHVPEPHIHVVRRREQLRAARRPLRRAHRARVPGQRDGVVRLEVPQLEHNIIIL